MSLQTGAEVIALALVFNKATGIYGFLTLFTGFVPSALQATSYTLSVLIIGALAYLIPHVRQQSPLQNLALAYLYVIDTVFNIAYTSAFATIWYLSGFKTLSFPAATADAASPSTRDVDQEVISGSPDTAASMVLVVAFTSARIYFSLVVMAYARAVLQRHGGEEHGDTVDDPISKDESPNPFAVGSSLGDGWKGKAGRAMVGLGRGYWLGGRKEDEEWTRDVGAKFGRRG